VPTRVLTARVANRLGTAALAAASLGWGCALAPGMQMNGGAAEARGRATTGNSHFHIQLIDPATIARVTAARAQASALQKDPLGDQAATYAYTIAPFDILHVVVWDHPELTVPTGQFRSPEENGSLVAADGTIFYPFVGTIHVAGMTVAQVRRVITQELTRVISNPQVDVRVAAYRGKRVQVTGEVTRPSTVAITDVPLRIQDALAATQGFTAEADFAHVVLSREGRTYLLNLQRLYEEGDESQNWLLQDGDVVNVPDRSRNKVFVLGEVGVPQSKLMIRGRMTLAEALMDQTGGFLPGQANVAQIFVIRGDYAAPTVFRLDASSADALLLATQFPLEPRDVVFVSTYGLTTWNRVVEQILPTVQTLWYGYDALNRSKVIH
jgi:polysaccharide export outer membrane protein